MQETVFSGHAIVFKGNKALLVRHTHKSRHLEGVYGIPGGTPEKGETMPETAIRELEEESGLKSSVDNLKEFPNNKYTANIHREDGMKRMTMFVYICTRFSGDLAISVETKPEWVEIGEMYRYNLLPNVKKAINDALSFLKNE